MAPAATNGAAFAAFDDAPDVAVTATDIDRLVHGR
jgi:hypothetical protein